MKEVQSLTTKIKVVAASVFWLLFLGVDVLKKSAYQIEDTHYLFGYYLFGFVLWFGLTFPLHYVFEKSKKLPPVLRVPFLLFMGPTVGSLKVILSWLSFYTSISLSRGVSVDFFTFLKKQTSFHYVEAFIIGWVVLLLFFLAEIYLKYKSKAFEAAELEAQLYRSQLQSLKAQIQPHFLFNSHNTIAMLIRTKMYNQAIEMTTKLSDLLRLTLDSRSNHFVTLKEEIELVKKYLDIEHIRFEDTLEIELAIHSDSEPATVPYMILQPIVENAIKHGISKHLGKAKIEVRASRFENQLRIEIYNTGPEIDDGFILKSKSGIGLRNVQDRLTTCYGDYGRLGLYNQENGVVCYLEMPFSNE